MTLLSINDDPIPNKTRFVAFYSDGSGADLFKTTEDGELVDKDGNNLCCNTPEKIAQYLLDSGFLEWFKFPETFRLWYELDHPEEMP